MTGGPDPSPPDLSRPDEPLAEAPPPDLGGLLCFAVHTAGFAFNRLHRGPLRRLGLTYPQYLVMVALWTEDAVTVGHLARRLCLETSTLTPLLKRLEASGLLTRRRAAADERLVMVTLTGPGRAMRRTAAEVTRLVARGTGLPDDQLQQLTREVLALRDRIEAAAAAADRMAPVDCTSAQGDRKAAQGR